MAGVMINGKVENVLYGNEEELRRSLRQLKAYNTPSDSYHRQAKEELSLMGSPIIESCD